MAGNNKNNENLKELFGKFLEPQQAEKAVQDIQQGESILTKYPAPVPDDGLIDNIKADIAYVISQRKIKASRKIPYKVAAIAAAIIIIAAISMKFQEQTDSKPVNIASETKIPAVIWEIFRAASMFARLSSFPANCGDSESRATNISISSNVTPLAKLTFSAFMLLSRRIKSFT